MTDEHQPGDIEAVLRELDELRAAVRELEQGGDRASRASDLAAVRTHVRELTARIELTVLPDVRSTGERGEELADEQVGHHTRLDGLVTDLGLLEVREQDDAIGWSRDVASLHEAVAATAAHLRVVAEHLASGSTEDGPGRRPRPARPRTQPLGRTWRRMLGRR